MSRSALLASDPKRVFEDFPEILCLALSYLDVDAVAKFRWIISKDRGLLKTLHEALTFYHFRSLCGGGVYTTRDIERGKFLIIYNDLELKYHIITHSSGRPELRIGLLGLLNKLQIK